MKRFALAWLLSAELGCGGHTTEPVCLDSHEGWCPLGATPDRRAAHVAVWTGKEVLIWGGYGKDSQTLLTSGLRIDPRSGRIRTITTEGAPEGRIDELAAWTGREMLIWGGNAPGRSLEGGGLYDPESDSWRPLTTEMVHLRAAAAWTGSELFVWGGDDESGVVSRSGSLLDIESGVARDINPERGPYVRGAAIVTLGSLLVLSGGTNDLNATAAYDLTADAWRPINSGGAILANIGTPAFAVGDAAYFCDVPFQCTSYSPTTDTWTPFAIPASTSYGAAWALSSREFVFLGGQDGSDAPLDEQGAFDFEAGQWSDLPSEGRPSPRWGSSLTAVADSSFFLWGGQQKDFELTEAGFVLNLR